MANTAPSFIGSKISLISRAEIRYEGILYTIDTRESTIALAQVRSFGTENRSADKYVPPRDEVYEYIIFRANDIKDLIVDDAGTNATALGDPAIIQAQGHISLGTGTSFSRASTTGTSTTGISTSIPVSTSTLAPSATRTTSNNLSSVPVVTNVSAGSQSSVTSGPPPAAGPAFGATSSIGFRSGGSTPTGTHRRSPVSESGPLKNQPNIPRRDDNKPRNHINNRDNRNMMRDGPRGGGGGGGGSNRGYGDRRMAPMQYPPRRPMGPGPQPPRLMNPRLRGRPRPPMPMMNPAPQQRYRPQMSRGPPNRNMKPATSLKIDGEYDFEKANKEFEELESKLAKVDIDGEKIEITKEETASTFKELENTEEKKHEANVFYDKTKSFFDKISCEALERSKGKVSRIDWRQERKMNAETFGISANNRGGYRGRGSYHGSGYPRSNRNHSQMHFLY